MACPTCDHTMRGLGNANGIRWFWCNRCGTLKNEWRGFIDVASDVEAPLVVGRVQQLLRDFPETHERAWALGVSQAVGFPRPATPASPRPEREG